VQKLEKGGLVFSGRSPDGTLMEIAELPREQHPFFLGTQFHPEFLARPLSPHPLFTGFVKAAKARFAERGMKAEAKEEESIANDTNAKSEVISILEKKEAVILNNQ